LDICVVARKSSNEVCSEVSTVRVEAFL